MDPQTPPLGYKPGQTRAPLIWNIALPLGVAAVTLACLRLYVRICLVRIFGKDDWLLLAAVIFLCGIVGSALWGTSLGIGKHQYDVNREIDTRKFIAVCYFYALTTTLLIFFFLFSFLYRLVK